MKGGIRDVHGVRSRSTREMESVETVAPEQRIGAGARTKVVVVPIAAKLVRPVAAVEDVVSVPTRELVCVDAAEQLVGAVVPGQDVVSVAAIDQVVERPTL